MNLLRTILIYLSMVYVSSVQLAPEPSAVPQAALEPTPTAIVAESATPTPTATPVPTPTPTPVPTPNITPNTDYKTIKVGDKGDLVREMQRRLQELGYYDGNIDGAYGNQTRRAVERFQYNNGLSVDGIAGKRTLTVLYESEEVVYAPAETTPAPTETVAPTGLPTAAITAAPKTDTPAPTFAPSPTPAPSAQASAAEESVTPAAEAVNAPTADAASPSTSPATDATPATDASPDATASTELPSDVPSETESPTYAPVTSEPILLEEQTILLAGTSEPLTLASQSGEEQPLHPMLVGEDVYVPFLEILRDAGETLIPANNAGAEEVAFSLANDLYRISYLVDQSGAVANFALYKNQQPQVLPIRSAFLLEGVLYLPMDTLSAVTETIFEQTDEAVVVTLPATEQP